MENLKKLAAKEAVKLVENGMVIGLGTGSTAAYAIRELGKLVRSGLSLRGSRTPSDRELAGEMMRSRGGIDIRGIPTSRRTERLAREEGIRLISLDNGLPDLTIDGVDAIGKGFIIKGGGGALIREKIVAYASKRFVIIADETKLAKDADKTKIPVEIVPFSLGFVINELMRYGNVELRRKGEKAFVTDNRNLILDVYPNKKVRPEWEKEIGSITGVVNSGIFTKKCDIIVGTRNGIKRLRL